MTVRKSIYKIYIEGYNKTSPGPSGVGIVIVEPGGEIEAEISYDVGNITLDKARFKALVLALKEASKRKIKNIKIYSHSEFFVRQFQGIYRITDPSLKTIKRTIRKNYPDIEFQLHKVALDKNQRAIELAQNVVKNQPERVGFGQPLKLSPSVAPPETDREVELDTQRSSGGVVYKQEGKKFKICMIAKNDKTVWALPKGRVDDGETPEQTAIREVLEETGHRAKVETRLDEIDYYFYWRENNTFYHKYVYFHLMPLVEENARPRDQEADAVVWLTPEEAYSQATYINEKEIIEKVKKIFDASRT
ncbi:MAG: NUDIX domain-containing protein [Vulcanimicrobiota bacterium]